MLPLLLILLFLVSVSGAGATCEVDVRTGPGDCVLCNGSALTSVGLAGADTEVAADSILYTEGGVQVDLLKRVSAWYQSAAQATASSGNAKTTMTANWVASVANADLVTEASGVFTIERAGWYRVSALGYTVLASGARWVNWRFYYDGAEEILSQWRLTLGGITKTAHSFLDVYEFAEGDELTIKVNRDSPTAGDTAQTVSLSFEYLQP